MEESAVVPRVLVVQRPLDCDGVEQCVAPDGDTALELLRREPFDTVLVDLSLAPLDGWYVLAAAGGARPRPRIVVHVADRTQIERANRLGADLCVLAGTHLHARALQAPCRQHPANNSRKPTKSGVPA